MSFKAVLFDMDGVIVSSEPLHVIAFRNILAQHGFSLSNEDYLDHFAGKTDMAGFISYFGGQDGAPELDTIMGQKAREYAKLAQEELRPYPGVLELIERLADQGVLMGLVTGSLRSEAELTLTTFGIREHFSCVVSAHDIRFSKPNPEGYLQGADKLGVRPADCVVIEDAPSGVAAAVAAGMRCLGVLTTHSRADLAAATALVPALSATCLDRF